MDPKQFAKAKTRAHTQGFILALQETAAHLRRAAVMTKTQHPNDANANISADTMLSYVTVLEARITHMENHLREGNTCRH